MADGILDDTAESGAGIIGAVGAADEIERHAAAFQHQPLDAEPPPLAAQRHHAQQLLALCRDRAKAVFEPATEGFELLVAFQAVQLTVEGHALAASGHLGLGEVGADVALDAALVDEEVAAQVVGLPDLLGVKVGELVVFQFSDGLR